MYGQIEVYLKNVPRNKISAISVHKQQRYRVSHLTSYDSLDVPPTVVSKFAINNITLLYPWNGMSYTLVLCFLRFALTSSSQAAGSSDPGNRATQAAQKSENTPDVALILISSTTPSIHHADSTGGILDKVLSPIH